MDLGSINPGDSAVGSSTLAKLSTTGNLLTGRCEMCDRRIHPLPRYGVKARFESSNFQLARRERSSRPCAKFQHSPGLGASSRVSSATALRDAPYAGLYLALYEACKTKSLFTVPGDGDGQLDGGQR